MNMIATVDRPVSGAYKVDISRGRNVSRVSSEWFSRPEDERYLSLTSLYDRVRARAEAQRVTGQSELQTEDEKVQLPDWAVMEVSSDPRYFNSSLLKQPFSTWK